MNKNIGFTIIELMIVVAIIGIIAAGIIPSIADNDNQNSRDCQQENYYTTPSSSH